MAKRFVWLIAIACSWSMTVHAHNVIGGVYAIGATIEGEIGFSNGDMAAAGTEVIVSDPSGSQLGKVFTDDEGFFSFDATRKVDHHFYANLSSGHILTLTLPAEQLPTTLSADAVSANAPNPTTTAVDVPDQESLQAMIESAVAKQVKPLRQELAALKQKAGLQDIIGGIGYIFGLCGLGIWWRQRHKETQQDAKHASVS